jgi:hypothetical protein
LLPHDRTRDQRHRQRAETAFLNIPTAWIPPVFAVAICGLHLAFWEHATAGTGEMLDLLLFAYSSDVSSNIAWMSAESWLVRMALVYGLATANNYAMIAYAPVFLIALIWIRGVAFFHLRFPPSPHRLVARGSLPLSPAPSSSTPQPQTEIGFWQALRASLPIKNRRSWVSRATSCFSAA